MNFHDQIDKFLQQNRPVPDSSDVTQKDDIGLDESDMEFLQKTLADSSDPPQPLPVQLALYRENWTTIFVRLGESYSEHLRQRVFKSKTHDEVLDVLSENGLEEFRQDYVDYLVRRQKDLEEGESPDIFLQSLQSWAWFLLDYTKLKHLPKAETSADFDGCLEMEWELSYDEIQDDPENKFYGNGRGLAVLTFYPASLNHLSILSGAYTGGKQRITLDCFLPHRKTIQIIDLFTERLLNPDE